MSDQEGFVGWAVVELFGHKRMAGHVSSQVVAGGSLVRIDVPETPADMRPMTPAYTKLVGVAAIYGITPVSEEVARRAAREIERWNDPLPVQLPALAAPVGTEIDPNFVDDDDDEDDEDGDDYIRHGCGIMTAEEIRQRGIDAVRALEGREVSPLIGELLEFRDETGRRLAAICEAEGIGPYDDALYGVGMEMIRRREQIAKLDSQVRRAVAVIARAWCDEYGNPREDEGIPSAAVHQLTDVLMGLDVVEQVAEGAS